MKQLLRAFFVAASSAAALAAADDSPLLCGGADGGLSGPLDVMILQDVTVSMKKQLATFKDMLTADFEDTMKAKFGDDIRYGVVRFNDKVLDCSSTGDIVDNAICAELTTPLGDFQTAADAIQGLTAERFLNTSPEDSMQALAIAATDPQVGWRDGAARLIIVLSDAAYRVPINELCGDAADGNCGKSAGNAWYDSQGCWYKLGLYPFQEHPGDYTAKCHVHDYASDTVIASLYAVDSSPYMMMIGTGPDGVEAWQKFSGLIDSAVPTEVFEFSDDAEPLYDGLDRLVATYADNKCQKSCRIVYRKRGDGEGDDNEQE